MQGLVDNVVTVTDAQLMQAMRLALEHTGVLLEPAGAPPLESEKYSAVFSKKPATLMKIASFVRWSAYSVRTKN